MNSRLSQLVTDVHELLQTGGTFSFRAGLFGDEVPQQADHLVVAVLTGQMEGILAVLRGRGRGQGSGHVMKGTADNNN